MSKWLAKHLKSFQPKKPKKPTQIHSEAALVESLAIPQIGNATAIFLSQLEYANKVMGASQDTVVPGATAKALNRLVQQVQFEQYGLFLFVAFDQPHTHYCMSLFSALCAHRGAACVECGPRSVRSGEATVVFLSPKAAYESSAGMVDFSLMIDHALFEQPVTDATEAMGLTLLENSAMRVLT